MSLQRLSGKKNLNFKICEEFQMIQWNLMENQSQEFSNYWLTLNKTLGPKN